MLLLDKITIQKN